MIAPLGTKAKPSGVGGRRRLCCLSRRSIQDQQNQTRDQHNGHHPPPQRVIMLASPRGDLHSRSSWPKSDQKMVGRCDPAHWGNQRQALNADYRMRFDECHSSDWL
jgi:hypothetical protein